jgi:hypothetical protein
MGEDFDFQMLAGMTTPAERQYFQQYAEQEFTGQGDLVDLGCWLGSTTVPLVIGLQKNSYPRTRSRLVHAYDLFEWASWMDGCVKGTPLEGRYQPGDSFLPEFERVIAPWQGRVRTYPGDLEKLDWGGGPIEFLLIDAMKSEQLCNAITRHFFPSLVPGVSTVLHQDYFHWYTSWIHPLMYRLRAYFDPVREVAPNSGSMVFRLKRAIPAHLLRRDYSLRSFGEDELAAAFRYSMELGSEEARSAVHAAQIMSYVHRKRFAGAEAAFAAWKASGLPLNYDVRTAIDHLQAGKEQPAPPLLSRWVHGTFGRLASWFGQKKAG